MINKLAGNPLLLEYVPVPDAKELILLTTILDMIYINDEALDQGTCVYDDNKIILTMPVQDVLYEQLRLLGFYKSEPHPVYGDWDKLITNWMRTGLVYMKHKLLPRANSFVIIAISLDEEMTLAAKAKHRTISFWDRVHCMSSRGKTC
jgi:hypothetical protein